MEHVLEPKEILKNIVTHLNNQGMIYVEVPLGVFREIWRFKDPLTHINFFSEESLFRLFKECGITPVYLSRNYQWIMDSSRWCINAIGIKDDHNGSKIVKETDFLTTKNQMYLSLNYAKYLTIVAAGRILRRMGFKI